MQTTPGGAIKVTNLTREEQARFESYPPLYHLPLTTHIYHRVFVTRSGLALKHFRLIPDSYFYGLGRDQHFYKAAFYNYLLRKKIRLNDERTYLLAHNYDFPGYFHWLMEGLYRVWAARDQVSKLVLLLPDPCPQYVHEALEPFHFLDIYRIPEKHNLIVKNVMIPSNPTQNDNVDPCAIAEVREFFHNYVASKKVELPGLEKVDKVYISRQKATRRKVENEDAVFNLLHSFGFVKIDAEDLSFFQQVRLMQQTKILVSIHGSGLANVSFMSKGSSVLELYKAMSPTEWHGYCFARIAVAAQVNYYCQFCQPTPPDGLLDTANLIIDLDRLQQYIKVMTANN